MPSESPSVWRAVLDYVVATEKQRLGLKLQRDIANAWGMTESLVSTLLSERAKNPLRETFEAIDQGLISTGRQGVWQGWTKRLYYLCHPPSPRFVVEMREHLDVAGFIDQQTAIRTSAGVILAAIHVKGAAQVCRRIPMIEADYVGDPAAIVHADWTGRKICCPDYANNYLKAFAFVVANDSMAPLYLSGDIVIAAPSAQLANGKQAVFKTATEMRCKTFYQKEGYIEFIPKNPAYDRVTFHDIAELQWVYLVIGMVRQELHAPTLPSGRPA